MKKMLSFAPAFKGNVHIITLKIKTKISKKSFGRLGKRFYLCRPQKPQEI
jgi:hypothetical protein